MLVSDAPVVVARAIKKDGVCDFGTGKIILRKCRHCGRSWEKGQVAGHNSQCPVLAAEMILANHDAAPGMDPEGILGHEVLGRVLVLCVERLGGTIEFTGKELDNRAGRGLGILPNKKRTGLVMSIMTQEECMGQ